MIVLIVVDLKMATRSMNNSMFSGCHKINKWQNKEKMEMGWTQQPRRGQSQQFDPLQVQTNQNQIEMKNKIQLLLWFLRCYLFDYFAIYLTLLFILLLYNLFCYCPIYLSILLLYYLVCCFAIYLTVLLLYYLFYYFTIYFATLQFI